MRKIPIALKGLKKRNASERYISSTGSSACNQQARALAEALLETCSSAPIAKTPNLRHILLHADCGPKIQGVAGAALNCTAHTRLILCPNVGVSHLWIVVWVPYAGFHDSNRIRPTESYYYFESSIRILLSCRVSLRKAKSLE